MVLTNFSFVNILLAIYFVLWIFLHNCHFVLTAEIIHLMIIHLHLTFDVGRANQISRQVGIARDLTIKNSTGG